MKGMCMQENPQIWVYVNCLCGNNPINDLEVFVENGVLCQNVWAIEKDSKVLEEAWKNVAKSFDFLKVTF